MPWWFRISESLYLRAIRPVESLNSGRQRFPNPLPDLAVGWTKLVTPLPQPYRDSWGTIVEQGPLSNRPQVTAGRDEHLQRRSLVSVLSSGWIVALIHTTNWSEKKLHAPDIVDQARDRGTYRTRGVH